jgi:hypothetical protein
MLVARTGSSEWVQRNFRLRSYLASGFEAVNHNTSNDIVVISIIMPVMTLCNRIQALGYSYFMFRFSIPSAAIWFQS